MLPRTIGITLAALLMASTAHAFSDGTGSARQRDLDARSDARDRAARSDDTNRDWTSINTRAGAIQAYMRGEISGRTLIDIYDGIGGADGRGRQGGNNVRAGNGNEYGSD